MLVPEEWIITNYLKKDDNVRRMITWYVGIFHIDFKGCVLKKWNPQTNKFKQGLNFV